MTPSPQLIEALASISRGWAVFPCHTAASKDLCTCGDKECESPGKHPRTTHGLKDCTTERGQVLTWWERTPTANIGIATGEPSGFLVLDVDPRHGGDKTLQMLIEKHGELPVTMTVKTGGGGWHYYFAMPSGVHIPSGNNKLGPGLDIKADGGYVVGAASLHFSGTRYVATSHTGDIVPMPEWMVPLVLPQKTNGNGHGHANPIEAVIVDGARNATLASLAGTMRRRGMSEESITSALLAENVARCQPLLSDDEVRRIAKSIARYEPAPLRIVEKQQMSASLMPYHFTDTGNAERLFARHGANIRWVKKWKNWATWSPPKWDAEGDLTVVRLAKDMVRALHKEALEIAQQCEAIEDESRRAQQAAIAAAAVKFALASEGNKSMNNMIALLKDHVDVSPDLFDKQPWLFPCTNGTIDLKTGQLRPHRREDYLTKLVAIDYDPDAPCHLWEDFLELFFEGNQELIDWIQKAVGYTLTGSTREQVFFLCHGSGSNGKSTFLDQLAAIMGEYAKDTPFKSFMPQRSEAIRNDIAALQGSRFVSSIETNIGTRLSEDVIKNMTGGTDKITARFLNQEFVTFVPTFKVWLALNHLPVIKDTSHAMWRRVCLIPFHYTIAQEDRDKDFGDKLKAELPGVLAWAVRGCVRWVQEGLEPFPEVVQVATKDYRAESDQVAEFIEEECVKQQGLSVASSALYTAFCQWAERQGDKRPMSMTQFGASLTEKKYKVDRSLLTRRKVRLGLGLRVIDNQE